MSYFKNSIGALKADADLLKSYLGISSFVYGRMFFDNRYLCLGTDPTMLDEFVGLKRPKAIFYDKTSSIHNGYITVLWPSSPTNPTMEIYHKRNHWNGVSIFKQTKDYTEGFAFTSDIHNSSAGNYFLKNNKMLIAFAQYWLDNNREKLKLDAPEALATINEGINFSNLNKVELSIKNEQDRVKGFLNQILAKGWYLNTKTGQAYITPRELECLHLLAKGNTGKEVSNSLGISPRTVEGHINNIRSKLGFICKSEMIKLYLEQVITPE